GRHPRGRAAPARRRLPRPRPGARRDSRDAGAGEHTMTAAPLRVLLVDDHAVMRAGFRMILESEPGIVVVGEAATGAEAVRAAHELAPDVICMDVQMPDMDGI